MNKRQSEALVRKLQNALPEGTAVSSGPGPTGTDAYVVHLVPQEFSHVVFESVARARAWMEANGYEGWEGTK